MQPTSIYVVYDKIDNEIKSVKVRKDIAEKMAKEYQKTWEKRISQPVPTKYIAITLSKAISLIKESVHNQYGAR